MLNLHAATDTRNTRRSRCLAFGSVPHGTAHVADNGYAPAPRAGGRALVGCLAAVVFLQPKRAAMNEEPVGGPLVLRHASKRSDGPSGIPDDWDVIDSDGRDLGRIFHPGAGVPPDRPWMWTITGAVVAPVLPSHGFAAIRDEAKAAFADTWPRWQNSRD